MPSVDMRIYLRRRNICMTEHLLERAKVRTPLEQVSRKRMPQGVGMQLRKTHSSTILLNDVVHAAPRQASAAGVEEHS